jgi:serine/threonine protein kinase
MPLYIMPLEKAAADFPDYKFVKALTPSAQKAAFHVQDSKGRDLCLKLIAPDHDVDRVAREFEMLQSISHPNVARVLEYTCSSTPGRLRHYLVEEFVEGVDLSDWIRGGPYPLPEVCPLFCGLLAGLGALADQQIVHRDIKPANVRVRPDGTPVIIDLGLSRALGRPDLTRTIDGARIGTPSYFAPEQFRGTKRDIDHRTDLFAAGILLYEALVGRHPFYVSGMHIVDLERAVCDQSSHFEDTRFRALDPGVQLILRRLLSGTRASRPAHASQVGTLLARRGQEAANA